jgi:hypothetical protein
MEFMKPSIQRESGLGENSHRVIKPGPEASHSIPSIDEVKND